MNIPDKLEAKIKKLLALSENGIDGEKETATKFLNNLLDKHGIKLEDLDDLNICRHAFSYKTKMEKRLLFQIISSVIGQVDTYRKQGGKSIYIDSTYEDFLDIQMKFDVYGRSLNENIEMLYSAFVQKNNIFNPNDKPKEPTEEEMEEYDNSRGFRNSIDRVNVRMGID